MLPFPMAWIFFFFPLNGCLRKEKGKKSPPLEGDLTIPWFVFVALITVLEAEGTQEPHWFSLKNKKTGASIIKLWKHVKLHTFIKPGTFQGLQSAHLDMKKDSFDRRIGGLKNVMFYSCSVLRSLIVKFHWKLARSDEKHFNACDKRQGSDFCQVAKFSVCLVNLRHLSGNVITCVSSELWMKGLGTFWSGSACFRALSLNNAVE